MGSMLDYIAWRGDLTLDREPWNDIDSLIMASICYCDLSACQDRPLKAPTNVFPPAPENSSPYAKARLELLQAAAKSARFGDLVFCGYVSVLKPEAGIQFSAVSALCPDGTLCVAYRSTDNTIVGWREDFSMSYMSPVPAQTAAVAYLTRLMERCPDKRVRVVGHSKGGNLALYAASHLPEAQQAMIETVASFDGPGLDDDTVAS